MLDESDHRAIGGRMDLFHQQEEAPGMVFWHPRGFTLYRIVEDYLRKAMAQHGYLEVRTPQLLSQSIWETSGHWDNFRGGMFALHDGDRSFALKPVNCPGHLQIFNARVHSYRDLPMRLCEFGSCHRSEPSGSLIGLMRVRNFVQDDGHVVCTEAQIEAEVAAFCALLRAVYAKFRFDDVGVKFSTRPALRAGSDEVWDHAEAALLAASTAAGLECEHQPGEGAFYGPKLEFSLRDARGRFWQCGTLQLDFVLPERFDAHYIDPAGSRARPVMIHRAVLGSIERFVGILLEHYRGDLPVWLAPEQVVVATISEAFRGYAEQVLARLLREGARAVLDARSETVARKVIDAREKGIPVFMTVGRREVESGTVTVRARDGAQSTLTVEDAIRALCG